MWKECTKTLGWLGSSSGSYLRTQRQNPFGTTYLMAACQWWILQRERDDQRKWVLENARSGPPGRRLVPFCVSIKAPLITDVRRLNSSARYFSGLWTTWLHTAHRSLPNTKFLLCIKWKEFCSYEDLKNADGKKQGNNPTCVCSPTAVY